MELVCPAGNLPSLRMAVDEGADAVYIGFKNETNARHFPGLNFNTRQIEQGIEYAHNHDAKVYIAINTYPRQHLWSQWQEAVDLAASLKVDAIIAADIGVLDYACQQHPELNRHLSVQGSATNYESLNFYQMHFDIKRAVIPRVLSLAQIKHLTKNSNVPIEVFGFGSLCVMVEGRCYLSSYVTGQSPNSAGCCSPAKYVQWRETPQGLESRLGHVLIDCYEAGEHAGYPTICKGRYRVSDDVGYAIEEPVSLNTMNILPELHKLGISAIKIEGRQRSKAYVGQVARIWRQAIDACLDSSKPFQVQQDWQQQLASVSEGAQTTLGAYNRPWQ